MFFPAATLFGGLIVVALAVLGIVFARRDWRRLQARVKQATAEAILIAEREDLSLEEKAEAVQDVFAGVGFRLKRRTGTLLRFKRTRKAARMEDKAGAFLSPFDILSGLFSFLYLVWASWFSMRPGRAEFDFDIG